jgi:hypothetical protein
MKNHSLHHPARGTTKNSWSLTSARGERISAVEGMKLTQRMATALAKSRGKTGDERRTLVKEQLAKPSANSGLYRRIRPALLPGTTILRNKLGLRNQDD